jgi:hypothetical protein
VKGDFLGWLMLPTRTFLINHFESSGRIRSRAISRPSDATAALPNAGALQVRAPSVYLSFIVAFWSMPS